LIFAALPWPQEWKWSPANRTSTSPPPAAASESPRWTVSFAHGLFGFL